jgi:hypothetical protein
MSGQDQSDRKSDRPRLTTRRSFLATTAVALCGFAPPGDDADDLSKAPKRLEAMRRLAKGLKVREINDGKPGPPLALRADPLMRYSNPTERVVDGTLWAWGERGRPPAVMKLGLWEPMPGKRVWVVRVDPLSMKQIEVECPDGVTWTSRKNVLELRPLTGVPAPDESAARRLIQGKDIARRFSVSTEAPNLAGRRQFRLMPHPIDRYSDPGAGLLDGLFFNFAFTNNPSMLLVVEAIADGDKERTWRFAIVRQGRDLGVSTALFDGKPVWSAQPVQAPLKSDLFLRRPMPVRAADPE